MYIYIKYVILILQCYIVIQSIAFKSYCITYNIRFLILKEKALLENNGFDIKNVTNKMSSTFL